GCIPIRSIKRCYEHTNKKTRPSTLVGVASPSPPVTALLTSIETQKNKIKTCDLDLRSRR
ncbi:unnamed protein product, partial [Linum tenue]